MSEEEIKNILNLIIVHNGLTFFGYSSNKIGYTAIKEALNLIDKLQKENEELKQDYIELDKENRELKSKTEQIRDKAELMDYYSLIDVIDDLSKIIGDYKEDE